MPNDSPREPIGKSRELNKIGESADRVERCPQLEKKRRVRRGTKRTPRRRSPKVELADFGVSCAEGIPAFIGDGNCSYHGAILNLARDKPSMKLLET
jgi:hypothetical protein